MRRNACFEIDDFENDCQHLNLKEIKMINVKEIQFNRINNCSNGNPRYVVHFMALGLPTYESTKKTREAGLKIYRGKDFGGGFVFSSYNPEHDLRAILAILHG